MLGRGRGHLIRADHAAKFLKREIDTLFANRRLVLVLDLDCTLIHASEPQKDFRMFHRKPGFELVCKTRGIYQAKQYPCVYRVKMRPFLAEFMIELLEKYHVVFYTAGTHAYGKMIVDIIKRHVHSFIDDEEGRMWQIVENTCRDEHIIARDDKDRYETK